MNVNNNDIFWEAMALLGVLLFQANHIVQNEVKSRHQNKREVANTSTRTCFRSVSQVWGYFTRTTDEVFFQRVTEFLSHASVVARERRSLQSLLLKQAKKQEAPLEKKVIK